MPSKESGGLSNFWYSFDYGLAHFIVLDTETDLPTGLQSPDEVGGSDAGANSGPFGYPNQQYDWFENDLASLDRDKTPWVIVGLHRPWYVGSKNTSSNICLTCQQAFEPLMIKYGVDLYMQGHIHVSCRLPQLLPSLFYLLKMTLIWPSIAIRAERPDRQLYVPNPHAALASQIFFAHRSFPQTPSIQQDSTTPPHPGTSSTVPQVTTTVSTRSRRPRTTPSRLLTSEFSSAHPPFFWLAPGSLA